MSRGDVAFTCAGIAVFIMVGATLVGAGMQADKHEKARREYFSHCTYHGSRIEGGFNSHTVYMYRCGDVLEESETRY